MVDTSRMWSMGRIWNLWGNHKIIQRYTVDPWTTGDWSALQFISFTQSCPTLCVPMDWSTSRPPVLHYLPECSNSCPLSQGCCLTISSSAALFSFCLQSFPASGSFPVSQLFTSGGQSIGASVSVLPMNIQDWFPWRLTGLISLQSKELSRVFYNTTVQKHRFLGGQLSLWSNSHIHRWLMEKP